MKRRSSENSREEPPLLIPPEFLEMVDNRREKLYSNRNYERETAPRLDEAPVGVEVTVGAERSFYKILIEAVDEALSSLGESAKEAIYFHLENTFKIKRCEIPYRIDDFSEALEKIFGMGARHLEILFMKNLHAKVRIDYKWDLPKWVVPELTFKEYIRMMKQNLIGKRELGRRV
ncbi:hypothetical protein MUP38_02945 [Candidatus Bathyarchaeota archaeon]|nr:hypothetical protein [Candidatus Bathyarchaeota archaeon]